MEERTKLTAEIGDYDGPKQKIRRLCRQNPLAAVSAAVIVLIIVLAILAPYIAPYHEA